VINEKIMSLGPYKIENEKLYYKGDKLFEPIDEVRDIEAKNLDKRHLDIKKDDLKWSALIKIWDGVFKASNSFMTEQGVYLFDLPITTRMISSPGALKGTIISDVDPFEIKFFDQQTFLTQSSQLYLEFAITNPSINSVYCWEKSFRREKADFRHLPEFSHIEFESNIEFNDNLEFQQKYLQYLIKYLIENYRKELSIFLTDQEIDELIEFYNMKEYERITFHEAFKLLKEATNDKKYDDISIKNFSAYEEVLLSGIIKKPVFVTHYILEEVAFYHASDKDNPNLAVNADFLFPGYGELIGSGERVHTQEETKAKAMHFKLDMDDYQPYIESRDIDDYKIHSGWGMGIERFIQCLLKLPFIWETKPFPRVDTLNRP